MNVCPFLIRCGILLAVFSCMFVMQSCDSLIYDGEGDCSVNYRVRFRYDYNMKYADAFAHEVNVVSLYMLDENGRVAYRFTEQGDLLAEDDYAMTVTVEPGSYSLLVWCGTGDKGSFSVPDTEEGNQLGCTLKRQHAADGSAFVDMDLDRLFHGWLPDQYFGDTEGTYTYTVPLVKDTNTVRVVLHTCPERPLIKTSLRLQSLTTTASLAGTMSCCRMSR